MDHRLVEVLEEAQRRGFLGPGPVNDHVKHARGLAEIIGDAPTAVLDLGTGGGIPGLVLALEWPESRATLLDSRQQTSAWLAEAVDRMALGKRVSVACGRSEDLARRKELREVFDLVVARSFGPPAVTAECAVGFLATGGRLVVSEPPDPSGDRWPNEGLAQLGFTTPEVHSAGEVTAAVLRREGALGERWPRRTGIPAKRPLWTTRSS